MNTDSHILRQHDVKDAYEYPLGFDQADLERRAADVHCDLETALGRRLKVEGGIYNQDASFSVAIRLTERTIERAVYVCDLRFSNFGNMVAVTDPDYYRSAEYQQVVDIVRRHGFTIIDHLLLDQPYDGVNGDMFPTWWIRYFDWI